VAGVLEGAPLVQTIGHRQRLAVIGDSQVLEPGIPRRESHRLHAVPSVGDCRVRVQVAAQIPPFDQRRQRSLFRGLELTAGLPQLGRDPWEAECGIDARLRVTSHALVVAHAEEAVLVQLEAEPDGAVA
jgi:hypothetical protein